MERNMSLLTELHFPGWIKYYKHHAPTALLANQTDMHYVV
jgi:hypothetical protein